MQEPTLSLFLTAWTWNPFIILAIMAAAAAYGYGFVYYKDQNRLETLIKQGEIKPSHPIYFVTGLFILLVALQSVIDTFSGVLFTMHMAQHLLLTLVVPPLLLLGLPAPFIDPFFERFPLLKSILSRLSQPLVALFIFNFVLIIWHAPRLYEAALQDAMIHDLEHAAFFWTGVLSWWPMISPSKQVPRLSYPAQMLYLFVLAIPGGLLGAWIVFTTRILYPTYLTIPMVWNMTTLEDQQLGGLLMMVPGKLVYFVALTIIFFRWFNQKPSFPEQPSVN